MEIPVELQDFVDRLVQILGDSKKAKIVGRNHPLIQKVYSQELGPTLPVRPCSFVNQYDRNDSRLTRLHQRQAFESFVHCTKPAGEKGDGMGLLDEIHFPREKVIETDQFRIPVDDLIGFL